MGAKFVPNRIFRGRIVEALRDSPQGMTFEKLGAEISSDWDREHREWLDGLLKKLIKDTLIVERKKKFQLAE